MAEKSIPELMAGWMQAAEAMGHWLETEGQAVSHHERVFVYGVMKALHVCIHDVGGPPPPDGIPADTSLSNVIPFATAKRRQEESRPQDSEDQRDRA